MVNLMTSISSWAIPSLLLLITSWGLLKKVRIYESFVAGAKEGFQTALRLLPFLIGMLVAIEVFQTSGALTRFTDFLAPFTSFLGFPKEVLPLALMRPISGSGSIALLTQTLKTYGPDSFPGKLAATLMGSTETTFYVLTVYAGSVNLKRTRHTLLASLLSDLAGFLAAFYIISRFFA